MNIASHIYGPNPEECVEEEIEYTLEPESPDESDDSDNIEEEGNENDIT